MRKRRGVVGSVKDVESKREGGRVWGVRGVGVDGRRLWRVWKRVGGVGVRMCMGFF